MRIVISILAGIVIIIVLGWVTLAVMNRPLSEEEASEQIRSHLTKTVNNNPDLSSVLLTIYSNQTGYNEQFAVGRVNHSSEKPVHADSPYHSASIGKTMCAAVFGLLVDEGKLKYDDKIINWLDQDILERLFVIDGIDYSDQVTIRHLLTHTSGAADYFEGPVLHGEPMLARISSNPDLAFTPQELISFTRDHQEPIGIPGQQFYYSDTGYILLGLILEAVEGQSYSTILEKKVFKPLGMDHSYLFTTERPAGAELLGIYIKDIDFSRRDALSVDWAGGGVVTTMNDLLTFMRALEGGEWLSDEVYRQMTSFDQQYEKGIHYSMGMMLFDFSELSFLLGSMTDLYGGVGATGTYMLYDKQKDTYFIANFGSLEYRKKGIEELIKIRMIYDRMVVE